MKNKIVKNASWIILCRIGQAVCSLIVTMLTARYLGPSGYGLVNYAASVVSFVIPVVQLGLNNIQVQELVNHGEEEGKIVGTSLFMSLLSAIAAFVGVMLFVSVANAGETQTLIVCALYSILLFFQGGELMQYWFQAKYCCQHSAIANLVAYCLVSAYKVYLLVTGKNIYWFAVSNAMDFAIILLLLLCLYKKLGGRKLQVSWAVAKRMLRKSKYYILADMAIMVFSQTDRIMLKLMMDEAATGYYSAAVSCASLANFVFIAIIDSYRPLVLENYQKSRESFENTMSQLYAVVLYLSILESICICVLASLIVKIIYGSAYAASAGALQILIWYNTFSFIGSVRNVWVLAEGRQRWLGILNLSGAAANVVLNLILIPLWGINGAAIASLVTQFFTNVVMTYLIPDIRGSTRLMLRGLNPKTLKDVYKSLRK